MAKGYDVSIDMTLNMVVRGAANETEALAIGRRLAYNVYCANEGLDGANYGEPMVTEFTINDGADTEASVDLFDDDEEGP